MQHDCNNRCAKLYKFNAIIKFLNLFKSLKLIILFKNFRKKKFIILILWYAEIFEQNYFLQDYISFIPIQKQI